MTERIDVTDYLLGELSEEERARAERLEREDPEFRASVERLRPVVGALEELPAEAWEALEPPPLEHPAQEDRPPRPRWRRPLSGRFTMRPVVAIAGAAAIAAIGLVAGLLIADDGGAPGTAEGPQIALAPLEGDGGGTGDLSLVDGERAELTVSGLPPSAEGDFYELWLLNAPDDLVSLGSFRVPASGDAVVEVPVPADPESFAFVDISREEIDGDPGHSGESILRGPT